MTVTRDEQRTAIIEAMAAAYAKCRGYVWANVVPWMKRQFIEEATAAFDAQHGRARVCPVEATEEIIRAGRFAGTNEGYFFSGLWRAMSAAGDLTNRPEGKV